MAFDMSKVISNVVKTASDAAKAASKADSGAKPGNRRSDVPRENQLAEYGQLANMGNQWALQRVRPDSQQMHENSLRMHEDIDRRKKNEGLHEIGKYDAAKSVENRANLEKWKADREKRANEYNNNPMRTQRGANMARAYGNFGTDLAVDPDKLTYEDDSGWNREYGEYERRFTDYDGNATTSPSQMVGLTTQQLTNEIPRAVYEDLYAKWDDEGRKGTAVANGNFANKNFLDKTLIDDGSDARSRQGQFMTGEQYYEYVKAGLPGRPLDEIDRSPNAIYNKQSESENYGFVPYIVDEKELEQYRIGAEQAFVSNVFDNFGQLRRILSDYKIKYGGGEFSGKEFEESYLKQLRQNAGKEGQIVSEDPGDPSAIPMSLMMTDADGNVHVAPGVPRREDLSDGTIVYRFGGDPEQDWYFEDDDDIGESTYFLYSNSSATGGNGPVVAWEVGTEPIELPDGRQVRADVANHIFESIGDPENSPDVDFDYGFAGMGNPNVEYPSDGFLPWITDMALSSAPYFFAPTSIAKAAGDTGMSSMGFRYGHNIEDDTYNLISGDPTLDQVVTSTVASAAMPLTERIWGAIGGQAAGGSPTKRIMGGGANAIGKRRTRDMTAREAADYADTIAYKLNKPGARYVQGAVDEGFEEIPGNVVEELQANGFADWNANGTGTYDSQRRENKNPDTGWLDRMGNFLIGDGGVPLAMFGGTVLGAGLGGSRIPSYRRDQAVKYRPWLMERRAERDDFGNNEIIPGNPESYDPEWRLRMLKEDAGTRTLDDYVDAMRRTRELEDAYQPIPWSLGTAASRIASQLGSSIR